MGIEHRHARAGFADVGAATAAAIGRAAVQRQVSVDAALALRGANDAYGKGKDDVRMTALAPPALTALLVLRGRGVRTQSENCSRSGG